MAPKERRLEELPVDPHTAIAIHFERLTSDLPCTYPSYLNSAKKLGEIAGLYENRPAVARLALDKLVEALGFLREVEREAQPEARLLRGARKQKTPPVILSKRAIVTALAECRHPNAIEHVLREADNPDWQSLYAVLRRLAKDGHPKAGEILERHVSEHPVSSLRERVKTLMEIWARKRRLKELQREKHQG